MDWNSFGFVQDTADDAPLTIAGNHRTGWESVIFQVADAERPRVLDELRAAIEEAEKLIEEWL